MDKYPTLYFIGYLIEKGYSWIMANSSGLKPADCLLNQGYPMEAIDILNELSRRSSGGTGCIGRDDCIYQPAFQLSCPHKSIYKTCSGCLSIALPRLNAEVTMRKSLPSFRRRSHPLKTKSFLIQLGWKRIREKRAHSVRLLLNPEKQWKRKE